MKKAKFDEELDRLSLSEKEKLEFKLKNEENEALLGIFGLIRRKLI